MYGGDFTPARKRQTEQEKVQEHEEHEEPKMGIVETGEPAILGDNVQFGESLQDRDITKKESEEDVVLDEQNVTVEVVKGSLGFFGKTYEKGDTFQTTLEKALSCDQNFVKIHK